MKKLLNYILISCALLTSCKYEVPPEMVIGNWYIEAISENGHDFTSKYVNQYNRHLAFHENGTFTYGTPDTKEKTWLIYSEKNELILLNGSPVENVTKWKIKASDEHIELEDKHGHYRIILKRIEKIPELNLLDKNDLIGKWKVEKVTINGYDNTSEYAFTDRWILLSKEGKFYNGGKGQNQNTGYWKMDESLSQINFFNKKTSEESFIAFHIEDELLWYEKQESGSSKPKVRIYFKKEDQ
ncbi:hypothetical protein JKA74_06325 [Marivirga sp. S37H4]|uniref:Lipocalin-like domain-containing protein n=1 Tax=Marivirga aurantiaca TaxID=2802615 RepID=A0A934WXH1_9BACT|nr:hypothetical protein [Marivirga aurantiaca]MBK6264646.1 hypothetical protein [Marivirga aurantiaca]